MKFREYFAVFSLGGTLYGILEVLWRGFTHWTMCLTGGLCFSVIYALNDKADRWPLIGKCIYGAVFITSAEFQIGCLVNLVLGWHVWDYSKVRGNIMGQVCPLFSAIWFILCFPALKVSEKLRMAFRARDAN